MMRTLGWIHRSVSLLLTAGAAGFAAHAAPPAEPSRRGESYLIFLHAQDLLQEGKWREAREAFERVIALDPGAVEVRAALARLCLRDDDLPCAETHARRAIALDPDESVSRRVLAEILIGRHRRGEGTGALAEALVHLEHAVRIDPLDTATWVAWIRLLGSEGRIDEAVAVTERATAISGADVAAPWLALSRVLLARGEADRAIRLLAAVDASGRAAIPLLETLAELRGSRGDLVGQEQTLQRLRGLKPEDPEIAYRLGAVRLELGDPYGALEPLEAAARSRSTDAIVRRDLARAMVRLGRGADAIALLEGLPEVYRSSHTLLLWAQAAEQAQRFKLAADKLEELTARLSEGDRSAFGPAVQLRAAQNRLRSGEQARVLDLTRGLEQDLTALRLRYLALQALGREAEVASDLTFRLGQRPHDPALVALAAAWRQPADLTAADEQALPSLLAALRAAQDRVASAAEVARWLIQLERPRLAARLLDAVGLPDAPGAELLRIRAATLDAAGRLGEAEAAFRDLLRLEPNNDVVLNDLGWVLAKQGRALDEAIELLERAVKIRPDEPAYLDSLGWALHRAGRSEESLPLLRRAAQRAVERDEPEIREHLGDVYHALGDVARAEAEWTAAMQLGTDARERLERKLEQLGRSRSPTAP